MIGKQEMMPVLLEGCPSFAPMWEKFLDEWSDEPEPAPLYVALGDLSRHLCDLLRCGERHRLTDVFRVIERLHVEGDDYVREAACIGILENIQNTALHHGTAPQQFVEFLGPESRQCWADLERFWNGGA